MLLFAKVAKARSRRSIACLQKHQNKYEPPHAHYLVKSLLQKSILSRHSIFCIQRIQHCKTPQGGRRPIMCACFDGFDFDGFKISQIHSPIRGQCIDAGYSQLRVTGIWPSSRAIAKVMANTEADALLRSILPEGTPAIKNFQVVCRHIRSILLHLFPCSYCICSS